MLSWIKKRCRRKSAPSSGTEKNKLGPVYFDLQEESINHDYEEIDDVISPRQLAYAIVSLTDRITAETEKDALPPTSICPVCRRCPLKESSTEELVCFCSVLNSNQITDDDDYELPENLVAMSCSTPDTTTTKTKSNRPDFSKRPLPKVPDELGARSRQPISSLTNIAEFSYDSYSSSSGYFDSSFNSQTDTSSDDSLANQFEKMAIREKQVMCIQKSQPQIIRQKSQPQVCRQTVCYSPPRPRMGCRALTRPQTLRRCRSSTRTNLGRFRTLQETVSRKPKTYENLPFNRSSLPKRAVSSSTIPHRDPSRFQCQRRGRSQVKLYENIAEF